MPRIKCPDCGRLIHASVFDAHKCIYQYPNPPEHPGTFERDHEFAYGERLEQGFAALKQDDYDDDN